MNIFNTKVGTEAWLISHDQIFHFKMTDKDVQRPFDSFYLKFSEEEAINFQTNYCDNLLKREREEILRIEQLIEKNINSLKYSKNFIEKIETLKKNPIILDLHENDRNNPGLPFILFDGSVEEFVDKNQKIL